MNKTLKYTIIASVLGMGLVGCQDDWDSHYNQTADTEYGTASLYEVIALQPELSDFRRVLDATKAFANSKQTSVTYKDLLGTDQFFTVWAPVNGTFNADSLIQLCATSEGDSLVEMHFVKNHVARFAHSVNGKKTDVLMMNNKSLELNATDIEGASLASSNIAARNGVLHTVQSPISYFYNIYEALVGLEEYQHIGTFLRSYQIDELDETMSLAMGIVDGKTVYIDSVFESKNELLNDNTYGCINAEDSLYWMIVPTKELWDSLYDEAKSYYNYAYIEKADSIHERWSHYALMQDLVFKPNAQTSINDSIVSTTYRKGQRNIFHTYYKPFEKGGLFANDWSATQVCSNGIIYQVDSWPYDKEFTFFKPISIEAEGKIYKYDEGVSNKKLSIEYGWSTSDSISGGAYIIVTPQTQTDKYYVEYELPDVLSGKYDVCIVFLPRNVNPSLPFSEDDGVAGKRNRRPSKFSAEITYMGTDGKEATVNSNSRYTFDPEDPAFYVKGGKKDTAIPFLFDCNESEDNADARAFINDPFKVDTIKLCTMHFPTCNYDQTIVTNRLKITNAITSKETNTYWGNWFIDRILLLPHKEEAGN